MALVGLPQVVIGTVWSLHTGDLAMTIDELIERLSEQRDALGGDAEVRLVIQQSWPLESSVLGVTTGEEINRSDDGDDEDVDGDNVLYLVEGQQLGYGSKRAWDTCY